MAESFTETNKEIVEEWPSYNIAKFGKNLTASEIRYYLEFQEYPNTSETGFASVYNVSGWDEDEMRKAFSMTNIQYSYRGIQVSKEQRQCLGVKVCEFASKELNIGHTSVDFSKSLFKKTFDVNEKFYEKATLFMFAKAHEYSCGYISENEEKCNGTPKLSELIQVYINLLHIETNEWEVSAYLPRVQKTLTFARIFTNVEMADAYQNLFEDLFGCIEKDM
ncbi:hypothetical protein C1646_776352 [Rhizophagus diaphanus]|nr:hypothetical protein C1646_776352 [Rhizophagus diaphanus] [Rhizophagus sp. MUCL 43196]